MGKGGSSFPLGRCDYPNIGGYRGLLAQILTLIQTLFAHFAYVMEGRQLTKVVLWASLWTPSSFLLLGLGMNTVSRFSFSQLVEMIHTDFQGLPPSYTILLFVMPGSLIGLGSGLLGQQVSLLLSSCIKFFVRLQW